MKTYEFYKLFKTLSAEEKKRAEAFLLHFCKGIGPLNRDKWILLVHLAMQEGAFAADLDKVAANIEKSKTSKGFFSRLFGGK